MKRHHSPFLTKSLATPLLILVWLVLVFQHCFADINVEKLKSLAKQEYGPQAQDTYTELEALIHKLKPASEEEKIKQINAFVNDKIKIFDDDIKVWGKPDYWATPLESFGKQSGDCEDYAIAKYLILRSIDIPNEKLKLTYVKAQIGGPSSKIFQAHMVLSYFPDPSTQPIILDNLISEARIASRRADLKPIFTFNSEGIWVGGTAASNDSSANLSRWRDLLIRAKNEGFE